MKRLAAVLSALGVALLAPALALANHVPHDYRHNPNCAWDSGRSVDWNGDGEPEHFVVGVAHDTSFPNQVVKLTGITAPGPISWAGANEGPDQVTVVSQGDHRMFGANPPHDPNDPENPEQLHNGAIYAHVDYDDVEEGRRPRAEGGIGIYEANHLVMACASSDGDPEAALCLNGEELYRMTDEECPQG